MVTSPLSIHACCLKVDGIEVYYAGDSIDAEAIREFQAQARQLKKSVGRNGSGVEEGVDRVWVYGDRATGARIGHDQIQGEFRPPTDDQASATAQRLSLRAQAPTLT